MPKKIIIIICAIACLLVGYFVFSVFTKRESDLITPPESQDVQDQKNDQEKQKPTTPNDSTEDANLTESSNETDSQDSADKNSERDTENEKYYIHVTATDCARECEPYQYDDKELTYCQNVCGIAETTSTNADCEKLKDLSRDYCLKDQAIDKKDASICENISDTSVKKTCKNRIQEDVLESLGQ